MTTSIEDNRQPMPGRALEYTVDANGCVNTNSRYRLISQADWDNLAPLQSRCRSPYDAVMTHVQAGRIVALPARHQKAAWSVRRTLRLNAQRLGLPIETKQCADPERPREVLVLVRKTEP